VQVSTIVISKLSIHIDSVPYNFQEIEIVVLDCHKLSLHVAHVFLDTEILSSQHFLVISFSLKNVNLHEIRVVKISLM
jgi:hypothetical protein